jgi:hypothetical protein
MTTTSCCQGGLRAFLSRKLGRCPRCLRGAALGTLLSWASLAAVVLLWPRPLLIGMALTAGVGCSLLAAAHLVVATRRVRHTAATSRRPTAQRLTVERRGALRAVAALGLTSVPAALFGSGLLDEPDVAAAEGIKCRKLKDSLVDGLVNAGPIKAFLDSLVTAKVITEEQRKKFGDELKKFFPDTEACLSSTMKTVACQRPGTPAPKAGTCCDISDVKVVLNGVTAFEIVVFGVTASFTITAADPVGIMHHDVCPAQCEDDAFAARAAVKVELKLVQGTSSIKATVSDLGNELKLVCKAK